jgi:tetratricopeptide (TPR) repeat protein
MGNRSKHFPTETAAMRVLTLSSAPRFDKSFTIGLWSVIFFAAAEIFTASFYYLGRFHNAHADAATIIPSTVLIPAPSAPPLTLKGASAAPAATISVLAEPDRLLKDALALREKGDMPNALAKLQEAQAADPKNATVLGELAKTYESMGLIDRSTETWRKVHELGPAAGDLFAVADKRLKIGVSATTAEATPAIPATASLESGMARMNADGIPDNSTFGISDVKATESPDPDVETNLMLRISVKKRDNAVADHTKVKIQVFFYDTVDDKDIKLTDADVNYEWLTPKHDWTETNPEILAVTYLRTKNHVLSPEAALSAAAAAVVPGKKNQPAKAKNPTGTDGLAADTGRRSYLGYIVRVYYHDQLQAVRADPPKLLSLFPTPSTAPSQ